MNVRLVRWWLRGGGEVCGFCRQRYAHGMQRWCVACDRAVCACCVVISPPPERAARCPECVAVGDAERE